MAQRIKLQDGVVVYQHVDPAADIDFYINGYLHVSKGITAATLGVSGTAALGPTTISGPTTINGPATITAPLTGATASFSGSVNASSVTASGTLSGATATISGSVNADAGNFTTSVTSANFNGTDSSLSGNLSANSGNFTTSVTAANFYGSFSGPISGNATTASALETPRSISATSDASWSVTFDGSADVTNPITLATVNSSPQADQFRRITVNGKGLVTATSAVTNSDITTSLGYTPVNKAGDTMLGYLILNATPVNSLGAVTKQYVDDIASGLTIHAACVTSTNGSDLSATYNNGASGVGATLTGTGAIPIIGGVTPAVGNRVLVKDQTAQLQNGIYTVTQATANWVMTRATDFDGSPTTEIQAGDAVYIQQGTLAGTQWVQTTSGTITVGTSSIVFSQFGGPGTYTAGSGINIAGTSISNTGVLSNIAGSGISVSGATGNVTIGNTGVLTIAGTANQITASASTGNITLSLPSSVTISGTMSAGAFSGPISGNATTASSLQTARTISTTGDATWSVSFDGSTNVTNPITLATVNANVGTFNNVTVNGKGLVTAASNVAYLTGNQTITLSGDISGSGTTAITTTLPNINANTGTFNNLTVNAKGQVTAASNVAYLTGNQNITISGDASGSGTTSIGLTFATVNGNVGSFSYPTLTVNAKGLVTAISSNTPVTSVASGTGISVSGGTGAVTISNTGVTSLAGTASQVSVSAATGAVTVSLPSSVTISGTMTAGAFNSTSTKRVKKGIKKLGKSYLSKFADLKPREYDRRDYQAHEFGFIAEEMAEVYPEIVGKDEAGQATGIDYGKLAAVLTAKVQEQEKTIDALKQQMKEILALVKGTK